MKNELKIGKRTFSNQKSDYYVIAEIGVNHEGSLDLAKKLIEQAKEGGAHAAKFQAYKAGKIASKNSPAYWDTSKEPTKSQFELFKKYDGFDNAQYKQLAEHCDRVGIDFMCTAFDLDFLAAIDPLVVAHKVASADLTSVPFLRAIGASTKPVILSTGASRFSEIDSALDTLHGKGAQVGLLHCTLNYPCPDDLAHLWRIRRLQELYPRCVSGYSDHTLPNELCLAVLTAYGMGGRIFEKHFTHDKTLPGNDHYHAMDVKDLRKLISSLDQMRQMHGEPSEASFLKCQESAIKFARRSIVLKRAVSAGQAITEADLTFKRPGTGVSPLHWDDVIGKKARVALEEDAVLQWSVLE